MQSLELQDLGEVFSSKRIENHVETDKKCTRRLSCGKLLGFLPGKLAYKGDSVLFLAFYSQIKQIIYFYVWLAQTNGLKANKLCPV